MANPLILIAGAAALVILSGSKSKAKKSNSGGSTGAGGCVSHDMYGAHIDCSGSKCTKIKVLDTEKFRNSCDEIALKNPKIKRNDLPKLFDAMFPECAGSFDKNSTLIFSIDFGKGLMGAMKAELGPDYESFIGKYIVEGSRVEMPLSKWYEFMDLT